MVAGIMGPGFLFRLAVRGAGLLLGGVVLAAELSGVALAAQDGPKAVVDGGVPTLHVYTNLIQIPTLVLWQSYEPVSKPIPENRFSVSIDSGRWFRATHVRQEEEDPISLAILLDVSGDTANLVSKMGEALKRFAPLSLHPKDRISFYALHCGSVRFMKNAPIDSVSLERGVESVLEPWMPRKGNQHEARCKPGMLLWDGVAKVVTDLSTAQGRRVLLAITDGQDTGSKNPWNEVRFFAQETGTAVFGLNYTPESFAGSVALPSRRGGVSLPANGSFSTTEDSLISLCELSGGIVMTMSDRRSLEVRLEKFVTMLRQRYIVEFPRPSNSTAGQHDIEVKIDKDNYLIRPAGVSLPVPDAALMADPTTIQSGPALAPEQGTRKVLTKPQ
jgi:hypothetical protein